MILALLAACTAGDVAAAPSPTLGVAPTVTDAAGGVCVSVQLDPYDAAHRATMIAGLNALGVREIRNDLLWSDVQPARDAWDWSLEDAWVGDAEAAGLGIIAMTAYGTPWASSDPAADSYYPPDDPADFAAFAAAAAARYAGGIDRYEIWNEPNSGFRFWKVGDPPALSGDPVGYAALFVPAADAIHAADPSAEVQIGGTFFHEQGIVGGASFVADAGAAQARFFDAADALAYHPYTLYPPRVGPEDDTDGEEPIVAMDGDMRAVGDGLPLVVTEYGWPAFDQVNATEQAAYIVRAFALAQADGVRDVCVYTLEDGADPSNPEDDFGLYTYQSAALTPAGTAYAALATAIDGMDAYGRAEAALGLPDGVYAVRWASESATATLLWSVTGTRSVTVPASSGACSDAAQTVQVGETPVWVSERLCG